ncbi:kinesin-like protein KIN-12C [Daucus carota subsp. sativus]|uniref:kinesin-like protein KIN-12C n=1 Tax=Daucus carota subsp. sativus TaxID=79200 RepID=UPI0007EEF74D|nr:PREDICTED: phragmoplast orienting kinesin-1 [Daucus carota subsp. sativus]
MSNQDDSENIHTSLVSNVDEQGGYSRISRQVFDTRSSVLGEITNIQVKPSSIKSESTGIVLSSRQQTDGGQQNRCDLDIGPRLILQYKCKTKPRTDADIFNEALTTEKVDLAEELQFPLQEYGIVTENLCKNNTKGRHDFVTLDKGAQKDRRHHVLSLLGEDNQDFNITELQVRLDMITGKLEEAHTLQSQNQEKLCEEGKLESNIRTSHLLEEVVVFQSILMEKLCFMTEDNEKLRSEVVAREDKIKEINAEWEKASLELTSFLLDGSKSLRDATDQIEYITGSFAHVNIGLGEHIENAAKSCVEKENKILLLERSLEDAQKTVTLMEQNLISLRGAAIVLTELQQQENSSSKECIQMTTTLSDSKLPCRKAQTLKKHKSTAASLFETNMETDLGIVLEDDEDYTKKGTLATMDSKCSFLSDHNEFQDEFEKLQKCDSAVNLSFSKSEIDGHSPGKGSCLIGSHALNCKSQQGLKSGHNQFTMPEMIGVLRPADMVLHEADASCCTTMKLVADGKVSPDCRFFMQFEEACATLEEAEIMINALLKANENSTLLASKCKQSREILSEENASLVEENKQLQISLHLKDEENERLHDQICDSLVEMTKMMSLLERSFLHMQRDTEAICKDIYSDAIMSVKEIQSIIRFSRSSVEDIYGKVLEKELSSSVLHQFIVAEYFKNCKNLGLFINHPNIFQDCLNNQWHINMIDDKVDTSLNSAKGGTELGQSAVITTMETFEMCRTLDENFGNNSELQKELEDIEIMLQGLLHEFNMLQKSTSTTENLKAENENLVLPLSQTWHELQMKTSQLDLLVLQMEKHKRFFNTDATLFASNPDIEQLKEKEEAIKTLEKEVVLAKSSLERQLLSLLDNIENDLRNVTKERDQLGTQVVSLQDGLDRANALANENEAIAVNAHQEVEASKIRSEQKEEEVKILKQLVKELEGTINVLEKKGYEIEKDVRRHQQMQDPSKIEHQPQWQRPLNSTTIASQDQLIRELHCRSLELHEAHNQILILEAEIAEQSKEIKWCKGHISELVLHAEAQASQYQQKYKTLEAMVREVRTESSNLAYASPNVDKMEKRPIRTRRSSSPFRCMMGGLVPQKNMVKDQELSTATVRIQELEELLVSRQKEVCLLNTRLAATENMTHDIIRDLLGVKLDMTNYANMMDHHQFRKMVKDTQQQTHRSKAMEKEILRMRRQINDLIEERDICIIEVNRREADICAIQMDVEQIQEREQSLIAENVLLKTEKINLHRRVAELDNMVNKVFGTQANPPRVQQQIDCLLKSSCTDLRERPRNSEKQLRGVNNEFSQYFKPESSDKQTKLGRR